jgi:hypothetical protein
LPRTRVKAFEQERPTSRAFVVEPRESGWFSATYSVPHLREALKQGFGRLDSPGIYNDAQMEGRFRMIGQKSEWPG